MSGDGNNEDELETTRLIEKDKYIRKLKVPTFRRKVAVLLSSVAMQIIINGMVFGLPVFYPELIAAFDSKRSDAVLVQSLYSGISTGGGILFTPFTMRYGLGPCAVVSVISGVVLFGVNLVASSLTMVIVTVGVLAGLGMSASYLVPYICVSWTFHGDPGVALVMLTVGSSLGQFIVPYLIEIFIQQYQWRGAFLVCGGLITQMIPFVLLIHLSREYFNTGTTTETRQKEEKTSRFPFNVTLLKDIVITIILLNAFLLALTGNVEAWFMVDILVSRGFERERGSLAVSMAGLAMLVGRLIGIVIQYKFRIPSVYHWIYLFPLTGIGHAIVINLFDYSAILAMIFCTATAFGVASSQTPAIMFEAAGRERFPQAIAMINLMYGLGNLFSGVLGGSIRDAYGDYKPMFYLACATALLNALLSAIAACVLNRRPDNSQSVILIKYEKLGDD